MFSLNSHEIYHFYEKSKKKDMTGFADLNAHFYYDHLFIYLPVIGYCRIMFFCKTHHKNYTILYLINSFILNKVYQYYS